MTEKRLEPVARGRRVHAGDEPCGGFDPFGFSGLDLSQPDVLRRVGHSQPAGFDADRGTLISATLEITFETPLPITLPLAFRRPLAPSRLDCTSRMISAFGPRHDDNRVPGPAEQAAAMLLPS